MAGNDEGREWAEWRNNSFVSHCPPTNPTLRLQKSYLRITYKSFPRITHKSYLRITHKSYLRITHKSYLRLPTNPTWGLHTNPTPGLHTYSTTVPINYLGWNLQKGVKKTHLPLPALNENFNLSGRKKSELLVITISATYFSKTIIVIEFIYLTD